MPLSLWLTEKSMKRFFILSLSLALPACSGDDSTPAGDGATDAMTDTSITVEDTGSGADATSLPDTGSATTDAGALDADAGPADADAGVAADASCPALWFESPVVDPSIAVPDGGGGILLHASAAGTQNYICAATSIAVSVTTDAGISDAATADAAIPDAAIPDAAISDAGVAYAWTLVTPQATLSDCHDQLIGHHFASEGGANFPEWQTVDGTYVVGQKHLPTFTPDGGAGSIPWLLLRAVDAGGAGTLRATQYVQRLNTEGGNAPTQACNAGSVGTMVNVPYTADYYFYGP